MSYVDMMGLDWMIFDGYNIRWYGGDVGDKSNLKMKINKAISGNINNGVYPISEGRYNLLIKDLGSVKYSKEGNDFYPIPAEGLQRFDRDTRRGMSLKYYIDNFLLPWGRYRARLLPVDSSETRNVYLHSSKKGHTGGCIETGGNEEIFMRLKILYYDKGIESIPFIVKY